MNIKLLVIIGFSLLLASCASIRRTGLRFASPMVYEAAGNMESEGNWDNIKQGLMGNLILLEGMLSQVPEDKPLLVTMVKGYSGYAFAINETEYLNDKLADNEKVRHKRSALRNYTKAFGYGLKYLEVNDINWDQIVKAQGEENGVKDLLDSELSDSPEDLDAVFFTAYSLAGMGNLQKDKMLIVGQIPIAKKMFDWVCEQKPDINFGACNIFYAAYEASRPRMLGGNPQKGKKMFLEYIKKHPNNLLARVAFLEYFVIPMSEEGLYKKQRRFLNKALKRQKADLIWGPGKKKDPLFSVPKTGIYQAMALKRFQIIKRHAKEIF